MKKTGLLVAAVLLLAGAGCAKTPARQPDSALPQTTASSTAPTSTAAEGVKSADAKPVAQKTATKSTKAVTAFVYPGARAIGNEVDNSVERAGFYFTGTCAAHSQFYVAKAGSRAAISDWYTDTYGNDGWKIDLLGTSGRRREGLYVNLVRNSGEYVHLEVFAPYDWELDGHLAHPKLASDEVGFQLCWKP